MLSIEGNAVEKFQTKSIAPKQPLGSWMQQTGRRLLQKLLPAFGILFISLKQGVPRKGNEARCRRLDPETAVFIHCFLP